MANLTLSSYFHRFDKLTMVKSSIIPLSNVTGIIMESVYTCLGIELSKIMELN